MTTDTKQSSRRLAELHRRDRESDKKMAAAFLEWGYRACEQGMNLSEAMEKGMRVFVR